ncbi:chaplin [Streptomyces sp. NPDC021622]|uniref:chaplin n=1 Tax=Streptomyces sp. NPDC021622 TaxID=3155013 RepID=UPI0033DFDD54
MRQAINKGMLTAAAATSILSLSGASAFAADADGAASDSPGILSGNSVQAPVDVPANACGNSVNAVAAANRATANSCANSGGSTAPRERPDKTEPTAGTKATAARGEAKKSPGVLVGNSVQSLLEEGTPHLPRTARVPKQSDGQDRAMRHTSSSPAVTERSEPSPAGAPADGKDRAMRHTSSSPAVTEPSEPSPAGAPGPQVRDVLAATGSDENLLAAAAAGSAALMIGGGILYRRGGAASRR